MLLNVVFLPVLFLVTLIIRHYFAVELDAVIYMPNRHFFISKDNKFWVTNEGGGFKREGFVNKICSRLTRVDIAAWWGVDKDETSCAKKPPFEGDSWLLLEKGSNNTCNWCYVLNEKEEALLNIGDRLITKWIEKEKKKVWNCNSLEAMGYDWKTNKMSQVALVLDNILYIWDCDKVKGREDKSDWGFRKKTELNVSSKYKEVFKSFESKAISAPDIIGLYANHSTTLTHYVFVYKNGDRMSCSYLNKTWNCEGLFNLYDYLAISQSNFFSTSIEKEKTTKHSTSILTTLKTNDQITNEIQTITMASTTIKISIGKETGIDGILIFLSFFLFIIAIVFIVLFVLWKWLIKKKKSSFVSETVSEEDSNSTQSGPTFPFDVNSQKTESQISGSTIDSSKSLLS